MNARAIALLMLISLASCSDQEQAAASTERAEVQFDKFVGHWEAKTSMAGDLNSFDYTALILGKDGTAEYKHCSRTNGGSATQSSGQIFSDSVVSEVGNAVLALSKPATPYYAEKNSRWTEILIRKTVSGI